MTEQKSQSERPESGPREIAGINDWLREHVTTPGANRVVMTAGIAAVIGDVALVQGFRQQAELMRPSATSTSLIGAMTPMASTTWARSSSRKRNACGRSTTITSISPPAPRIRATRSRPFVSLPLCEPMSDETPRAPVFKRRGPLPSHVRLLILQRCGAPVDHASSVISRSGMTGDRQRHRLADRVCPPRQRLGRAP